MRKKGKHTSVEKNLRHVVRWLESVGQIRRVVLGRTESCRHSFPAGYIRHQRDVPGGFKANGYGGAVIVDLFIGVKPEDMDDVKTLIKERFGE